MRRGSVAVIAQKGVYKGKPRPAVIIQAEALLPTHPSILVCLVTGAEEGRPGAFYRIPVEPTSSNGLEKPSVIMADKIETIRRENVGQIIGYLDEATLGKLDTALLLFQGLA
jgi:mRNA interferase MazF